MTSILPACFLLLLLGGFGEGTGEWQPFDDMDHILFNWFHNGTLDATLPPGTNVLNYNWNVTHEMSNFVVSSAEISGKGEKEVLKQNLRALRINALLRAEMLSMTAPPVEQPPPDNLATTEEPLPSIADINSASALVKVLYDGDMILSDEQLTALEERFGIEDGNVSRKKRSANKFTFNLWDVTKPIYYYIKDPACTAALIDEVVAAVNGNSCIVLRRVEEQSAANIVYTQSGGSCNSNVGRINADSQPINLGPNCCQFAIVQHETLHALGFLHEHNRYDRDNYINVFWDKIRDSYRGQFNKNDQHSFIGDRLQYDLLSVMHYPSFAFRKSGEEGAVMLGKAGQYISYPKYATFRDFQELNTVYQCSEKNCPNTPTSCSHNGYPNPNKCSECVCPDWTQSCRRLTTETTTTTKKPTITTAKPVTELPTTTTQEPITTTATPVTEQPTTTTLAPITTTTKPQVTTTTPFTSSTTVATPWCINSIAVSQTKQKITYSSRSEDFTDDEPLRSCFIEFHTTEGSRLRFDVRVRRASEECPLGADGLCWNNYFFIIDGVKHDKIHPDWCCMKGPDEPIWDTVYVDGPTAIGQFHSTGSFKVSYYVRAVN